MKTCILTLDFINDICHPNGKISRFSDRLKENKIIENTDKVTDWGRKNGHLVGHVLLGFRSTYVDCPASSPLFSAAKEHNALTLGEWGTEFCDELVVDKNDVIITKHRVSAFYNTDLETLLRANKIEQLILTGVATNNAIELTAREAHDRDYITTIIKDACETASDEEQAASFNFLERIVNIKTSEELIK